MRTPPSTNDDLRRHASRITLKNGATVLLRPITPGDGPLLADLFSRMSPRSIQLRFLRRLDALPQTMIRRLATVDYDTEFALVAIVEENGKDAVIAVGRYGRDPDEGGTDLAVAVRDDWQHLGLGKPLLKKIVEIAKDHGITRFTGMMDPRNAIIKNVLSELGYRVTYSLKSGFFHVEIVVDTLEPNHRSE